MGARIFRALLRWLPGDFRSEFADAMRADAGAAGAHWWMREIPGLVSAVVREQADGIAADTRYALRHLARTPGFTLIAILMIAGGTGANAAVFSVVDAAIFRPAFADADRVVLVGAIRPDGKRAGGLTFPEWNAVSTLPAFTAATPVSGRIAVAELDGDLRRLNLECTTAAVTAVTGVQPALGRSFTDEENRASSAVVMISDSLWRRSFGARADAIGSTLKLDGRALTIIGVMPRGYLGVWASADTEAFGPLGPLNLNAPAANQPSPVTGLCGGTALNRRSINVYARLASSLTPARAGEMIDAAHVLSGRALLTPSYADSYDNFRGPMIALSVVALCVLLIACVNIANLQLERLAGRRRDTAVRFALGASRFRVVRQSVIENILIAAAGALAGLAAAQATLAAIASMMPPTMPNTRDLVINGRVLWISIGATLVGGLIVGVLPALQMTRRTGLPSSALATRGMAGGAAWMRRGLVIAEVALSVALLIGASLMVRTFWTLQGGDFGFETTRRFTARTNLPGGWVPSAEHRQFVDETIGKLSRLPGVHRASVASYLPLGGYTAQATLRIDGRTDKPRVWAAATSTHFLEDLGAPIVAGRGFAETDTTGAEPVALVNETFAREYFPRGAVGQRLSATSDLDDRDVAPSVRTIVGVVGNLRQGGRDRIERPELYVPYAQESGPAYLHYLLLLDGPANAQLPSLIKAAIREVRPGQTVERIESLDDLVNRAFARPRFGAWVFAIFAGLAGVLAALGLAAVVAWWVRERRRELAVRLALGARPADAVALVMKEAAGLTSAGACIGAGLAFAGTRLIAEWLYGVTATDVGTFAAAIGGLLAVALFAAWIPARRAATVDPAITLRAE